MSIKTKALGSAGSAADLIAISAATNATPIVITVGANSGLKTGDRLAIAGVTGNTGANGIWPLEAVTATTFKLLGSVGNGAAAGTIRAAQVFDQTPLAQNHSAKLAMNGNLVGTVTLTAFGSYSEFAANDNSLGGAVQAPVISGAAQGVTNVNATSASTATKATSAIVMAATNAGMEVEVKLPYILHATVSAFTSGTVAPAVSG
jgi:hypothetical protein